MPNFLSFDYLRDGNPRQRLAHAELEALRIAQVLSAYTPVLAGTIPIEIDVASSDLDIICCVDDFDTFEKVLIERYCSYSGFVIHRSSKNGQVYTVANFQGQHFEIEIFGQSIPVVQQNAFRHMVIEHQLLQQRGEAFRNEIIRLKTSGIKTEPAFAMVLKLEGDPYDELLKLEAVET